MKDFNAYNEAIGYKDGLMYYNIPIEHLNNAATTTDAENKRVIPVAKYGIVRNHHYVVTVNSLTKIGKGILRPRRGDRSRKERRKGYLLRRRPDQYPLMEDRQPEHKSVVSGSPFAEGAAPVRTQMN